MMGKTLQLAVLTVLLIITASCGKDDSAPPTAALTGKTWYLDSSAQIKSGVRTSYIVKSPEYLYLIFLEKQMTVYTSYDAPLIKNFEKDGDKLWIWALGATRSSTDYTTILRLGESKLDLKEQYPDGTVNYMYLTAK